MTGSSARRRWVGAMGMALGTVMLAGCVVAPLPYDGPVVAVAPPPVQAEVIGVAPVAGQVWIGGYWGWVGNRHVWVNGHWGAPRYGYSRWVPPHWEAYRGGWRQRPGYWSR